MTESDIIKYIQETFPDIDIATTDGAIFFCYDPKHKHTYENYFATIVSKDDDHDNVSNLNRPEVFRLNIGITKNTYLSLFGTPPKYGTKTDQDFTLLDQLMPHPSYAQAFWVSIISPSVESFEKIKPLLKEAYTICMKKATH